MFPRSWSSYIILKYKWSKHESWTLRYQPWTTLKKKKNQEKRLLRSHPIMNQKDTFRKNQHWIINKRIFRGSQLFFQGACTDMAVVDKSPVQTMGGGGEFGTHGGAICLTIDGGVLMAEASVVSHLKTTLTSTRFEALEMRLPLAIWHYALKICK